jgi:hypothetical protein
MKKIFLLVALNLRSDIYAWRFQNLHGIEGIFRTRQDRKKQSNPPGQIL